MTSAVGISAHGTREGAEDGLREPRLTGEVAGVRGAGVRLGQPGRLEHVAPGGIPPVERGGVDLGMELDAGRGADPERLAEPVRAVEQLDGAGRRLEAVLVPVQAVALPLAG